MPRIFWTDRRKAQLLKDAQTLTLKELARTYFRSTQEIEHILEMLNPGSAIIEDRYAENGHVVTVYRPGYAFGVRKQLVGENHAWY